MTLFYIGKHLLITFVHIQSYTLNNTETFTRDFCLYRIFGKLYDMQVCVIGRLYRLVGILSINCIGFEFKKTGVRGRGLYPLLSLVSHSCVSNARYTGMCKPNYLTQLKNSQKLIIDTNIILIY